jgi:phosphoadenosine phosphosulfate reductase
MSKKLAQKLTERFRNNSAEEILTIFIDEYKGRITLSSSMGAEDQVITRMIASIDKTIPIFTLDTGRLFPETYDLIAETEKEFGLRIKVFNPDNKQVEQMVSQKGINLFYENVENRKLCCHIRKIEPLKRALKGYDIWICGLRRDQSLTRFLSQLIEWDEENGLLKLNPLINWTETQVWDYIKQHKIPYNKLHNKGFPSIGCQPCTRAILPGEDIRAGRWYWEQADQKECGLHNRPDRQ